MAQTVKKKVKDSSRAPLVSVVMSVYNGEKYLREAIDSILNQNFTDFEFIIINDGSADDTLKIIKSYKDPRIALISRKNKGLVASLNEGIEKSKGKYIARQDADDISVVGRFEKQALMLEASNGKTIIGSSIDIIDTGGEMQGTHYAITGASAIEEEMGLRGPFAHGSVMAHREIFLKNPYRQSAWPAEDFDLWSRLLGKYNILNISEALYRYRQNTEGISSRNEKKQVQRTIEIQSRNQEWLSKNHAWRPLGELVEGENHFARRRIIQNRGEMLRLNIAPKSLKLDYVKTKLRYIAA